MSQTGDIRAGLKATLDGYAAQVALGPSEFDTARGRGFNKLRFLVRIYMGPHTTENEDRLDALLDSEGDESIKERLESADLEGVVRNGLFVSRVSGHQLYKVDDQTLLGAEWTVDVTTG